MRKYAGIELMESAPVSAAILRLAVPMMLGSVAGMIYNMTDTFFIGQTNDPNMVAGISLSMPLFMLSQGLGNIFATGASSYISRCLGAKRMDEAKNTNATAFWVTLFTGLFLTALITILREPVLRLIGTSEVTFPYANSYFTIISMFISVSMLGMCLGGAIRSEGASTAAMISQMAGLAVNIILDPLFILYFKWGVAGAAWATVAGQITGAAYAVLFYARKKSVLSIHPRFLKPNRRMLKEIFKIGIPSALSNVAFTVAMVAANIVASSYGDFVVAGSGISMRVSMLAFDLVMSLSFGFAPFAGFNYGARNLKRLIAGLKVTIAYTTGLAFFFLALFLFLGRELIMIFIRDEKTIEAGARMMRAFLIGLPTMGVQMTILSTFQALGKPIHSMALSLGPQFLVYLPLLFILNHFFGFTGFIYTQPIADITTAVVAILLGISLFKNLRRSFGGPAALVAEALP
ncbi:MAG: MATE family efflux transporter [Spirochaetaceae bacterium]|jgi:putative MATE family efflux protein|nr:MATE family efflux transporter [Spirochaetaceae bacterium]